MTATTALTAQNTLGVEDIHEVPTTFVKKQIDACFDDVGVDIVKTGISSIAMQTWSILLNRSRHACIRRDDRGIS